MRLPEEVQSVVELVSKIPNVCAVVLGGSRAIGTANHDSDWDLGVYYRGAIEIEPLARFGTVFPPGAWGRLMNGGAWLKVNNLRIDVLLRDLDVVDHWTRRAEAGVFERDALLGYLAGAPTYLLAAETASCRVLEGSVEPHAYPGALSESAPHVWRFCRDFSLDYAQKLASGGDVIGMTGHVAAAVMQEAHARLCEQQKWVCNEKRLIEMAGLKSLQEQYIADPPIPQEQRHWVQHVATALREGASCK
jgi:predicted nucleotidyltransferase